MLKYHFMKVLKMNKRTHDNVFGKKIYLLGKDKDGKKLYLEAPSWDCEWYWGFGYIERYNNANPERASDIISHSHWDDEIVGKRKDGYCHHLNENKDIVETVLTDKESWILSELMKSYYILRETADFYNRGGSHLADSPLKDKLKNDAENKRINKVLLPLIFKEIDKLLSPKED